MNLKQLASHLKLSQTTVSRALNGYPEVNEDTRRRVLKVASEMNYRPNARAKGLATGRAMAIGHVIPVSSKHEMVNPIFGDFIAGAGEAYAAAGYDMVLSLVADRDEAASYRAVAAKGSVDGMIVHGPKMDDPRIALLRELGLPFVVHGRASHETAPYSWLDIDNRRAFFRATKTLLDLGHSRLALINGPEWMDFAYRRRDGFVMALAEQGLTPDPALMMQDEMTELYGHKSAQHLLALPDPPTAFVCASMITALGLRRAIHDAGLVMGRDVSVVTHDDDLSYLRNGDDTPVFTATRSSVREAGRQSAQMLLEIIANPSVHPRQHLMQADLIMGTSTGPRRR